MTAALPVRERWPAGVAPRPDRGDRGERPALRSDEVPRHAVRLVVVDPAGARPPRLARFAQLPRLLRAGDLVVVNDAATLPGSLPGVAADGARFELRLSGPVDAGRLSGRAARPGRPPHAHRGPRAAAAARSSAIA